MWGAVRVRAAEPDQERILSQRECDYRTGVSRGADRHCGNASTIGGSPGRRDVMQLHGGIGYTWESGIHVYLKRATLNRSLFGTPAYHRARLATRYR